MPNTLKIKIGLALLVTWLAFGSTFLAIKVALQSFPPLLIAGINLLGAGTLLLSWLRPWQNEWPGWAAWRSALLRGFLLFFLGRGGVVWGAQYLSSGSAALLFASSPLWIALLGTFFFHERLRPRAILGLAAGFGGLCILVAPVGTGLRLNLLGAGLLTASAVSWAFGSLLARRASPVALPLVATAMQMLAGGALLMLGSAVSGEWRGFHGISRLSIAAVAYLTVVVALMGFTAFSWLLQRTSSVLASTFSFVSPVVAVLLGWAILHEPITARMALASGIILAGVGIMVTGLAQSGEGRKSCDDAQQSSPSKSSPP